MTELAVPVPFPYLPMTVTKARVPPNVAKNMMFEALVLPRKEMFAMGVGEAISDNPEEEAKKWLEKKIAMGVIPFGITKQLWWKNTLEDSPSEEEKMAWTNATISAMMPGYASKL